jgi:hypothetical protein
MSAHRHVLVVKLQEVVKHPVRLSEVISPPGKVAVAFLSDLVQATGWARASSIPTRGDILTFFKATQETVDRA